MSLYPKKMLQHPQITKNFLLKTQRIRKKFLWNNNGQDYNLDKQEGLKKVNQNIFKECFQKLWQGFSVALLNNGEESRLSFLFWYNTYKFDINEKKIFNKYVNKSSEYIIAEKWNYALEYLKRAEQTNYVSSRLYYNKGIAYFRLKKKGKLKKVIRKAKKNLYFEVVDILKSKLEKL